MAMPAPRIRRDTTWGCGSSLGWDSWGSRSPFSCGRGNWGRTGMDWRRSPPRPRRRFLGLGSWVLGLGPQDGSLQAAFCAGQVYGDQGHLWACLGQVKPAQWVLLFWMRNGLVGVAKWPASITT